jgi:orotidine-5'-phosphate decarboxylase
MNFTQKLQNIWTQNNSLVCIGLDPDIGKIPECIRSEKHPLFIFNKALIEATADVVCAYKPQFAYYLGQGMIPDLEMTLDFLKANYPHIPVILDAKFGDIGPTAEMYARAAFQHFCADAVTVNPYMGGDTLKPFLRYPDKGTIILCRTSNPGSGDFQDLVMEGSEKKLYVEVAEKAAIEWNAHQNVALVVGATWPEELQQIRKIVGNMPILVPGIGAQGGDIEAVMKKGQTALGFGLIINSSRNIIYAGSDASFAEKARAAAIELQCSINQYRNIA